MEHWHQCRLASLLLFPSHFGSIFHCGWTQFIALTQLPFPESTRLVPSHLFASFVLSVNIWAFHTQCLRQLAVKCNKIYSLLFKINDNTTVALNYTVPMGRGSQFCKETACSNKKDFICWYQDTRDVDICDGRSKVHYSS